MTYLIRVRPYCQIALWLAAIFVAIDLTLSGLTAAWLPTMAGGTGFLEDGRARVASAVREYRDGRIKPSGHLGAIVGLSNVREGIDVGVLTTAAGPDWHFLGLGGSGLGIEPVARYADLLVSSDLHPDLVIIGFGLHQLVVTRLKPGANDPGAIDYLRRAEIRNAASRLASSVWLHSRRRDLSLTVQTLLLSARASLFRRFGVELANDDANRRSPWREMIKTDLPEHFPASILRDEEQSLRDSGAFDPGAYENSSKTTATLIDLLQRFCEKGAQPVMVLMPEHSTVRRQIPPEALPLLETRLRQAFPGGAPAVLNFRESMSDNDFVDLIHLNGRGSAQFSRLLAAQIRDLPKAGLP